VSTIASRVARLGSSLVARAAVCSADGGQISRHFSAQNTMAVASHPALGA